MGKKGRQGAIFRVNVYLRKNWEKRQKPPKKPAVLITFREEKAAFRRKTAKKMELVVLYGIYKAKFVW